LIVADTSVWVAAMRRPGGAEASTLRGLLDADEAALALPVRIELMAGVAARHRRAMRRGLSALPVVFAKEDTWATVERWVPVAADAGQHFSVTDLLIAALAHDIGALVWSLDGDFGCMEPLKFVRLYSAA
jgi:predicted nucleic acid-binding protein